MVMIVIQEKQTDIKTIFLHFELLFDHTTAFLYIGFAVKGISEVAEFRVMTMRVSVRACVYICIYVCMHVCMGGCLCIDMCMFTL